MVWIEEIKLRAATNKEKKALQYLTNMARRMEHVNGLAGTTVLTHAFLANDFSFQLLWNKDAPADLNSEEGMSMRTALKHFGLVNYDVWIKEK